MRKVTKTFDVFTFNELSKEAQEKAVNDYAANSSYEVSEMATEFIRGIIIEDLTKLVEDWNCEVTNQWDFDGIRVTWDTCSAGFIRHFQVEVAECNYKQIRNTFTELRHVPLRFMKWRSLEPGEDYDAITEENDAEREKLQRKWVKQMNDFLQYETSYEAIVDLIIDNEMEFRASGRPYYDPKPKAMVKNYTGLTTAQKREKLTWLSKEAPDEMIDLIFDLEQHKIQ